MPINTILDFIFILSKFPNLQILALRGCIDCESDSVQSAEELLKNLPGCKKLEELRFSLVFSLLPGITNEFKKRHEFFIKILQSFPALKKLYFDSSRITSGYLCVSEDKAPYGRYFIRQIFKTCPYLMFLQCLNSHDDFLLTQEQLDLELKAIAQDYYKNKCYFHLSAKDNDYIILRKPMSSLNLHHEDGDSDIVESE